MRAAAQRRQRRKRGVTSVNIVAEEQVVGLGRKTAVLEQAEEVEVLPVQIACERDTGCPSMASLYPISSQLACRHSSGLIVAQPASIVHPTNSISLFIILCSPFFALRPQLPLLYADL